jgi:hypothetical protein
MQLRLNADLDLRRIGLLKNAWQRNYWALSASIAHESYTALPLSLRTAGSPKENKKTSAKVHVR